MPCDTPSWSEWLQLISPTFTKDPVVSAVFEVGFFAFLEHHTNIIRASSCIPVAQSHCSVQPKGTEDFTCVSQPWGCWMFDPSWRIWYTLYTFQLIAIVAYVHVYTSTILNYLDLYHLNPSYTCQVMTQVAQTVTYHSQLLETAPMVMALLIMIRPMPVSNPHLKSTMQPARLTECSTCCAANSNSSWYSRNNARGVQKMALS